MTSRRLAVLLSLVGAAVVLATQGRPWATGRLVAELGGTALSVTGGSASPGAGALALVSAAAAVVLLTAGRTGRRLATVLLMAAGAAIAASALFAALSPRDELRAAAATATGTTAARLPLASAQTTPWPLLAGLGGLCVVAGGAIAASRSARWAGPSRKYEPVATVAADPSPPAWDALSRGEDPTA